MRILVLCPPKSRPPKSPVRVRFSNTGRRSYLRAEAHLAYPVENSSPLKVTFAWKDGGEVRTASHTYGPVPAQADRSWRLDAGASPATLWVEYAAE